jgi:hypothetical protein
MNSRSIPSWLLFGLAVMAGLLVLVAIEMAAGNLNAGNGNHNGQALEWDPHRLKILQGTAVVARGELKLNMDTDGQARIGLPVADFPADGNPLLVIHADGLSPLPGKTLLWRKRAPRSLVFRNNGSPLESVHGASLPRESWSGHVTDLRSNGNWEVNITQLEIALRGKPGETVTIRSIGLKPATIVNRAAALLAAWTQRDSWAQWSINVHKGEVPGSTIRYRVPSVVVFLATALAIYGLLLLLLRLRTRFDWRVAGAILFLGWVGLDAPWQWSLWQQLGETRARYDGKNAHQKALSAGDAAVYELTQQILPLIGKSPKRVFIATPYEYLGLRAAYHLYPHNPFWARNRPELPPADFLGPGDFVLVLKTQQVAFTAKKGVLAWPEKQQVRARKVFSDELGQLFRVL